MKKMMILRGIALGLSILLLYFAVFLKPNQISIPAGKWIVNDKYYGQPVEIRSLITPNAISIQQFIKQNKLNEGTQLERIAKCYNIIEQSYKYKGDEESYFANGETIVKAGPDLWNYPILDLANMKQNGIFVNDCDGGTFLLASLLIGSGVENVWACIGEVTIPKSKTFRGGTFGHGWVIVYKDQWCLLETTTGHILKSLEPLPANYSIQVQFTDQIVKMNVRKDLNDIVIAPPLPIEGVKELNKLLDNEN